MVRAGAEETEAATGRGATEDSKEVGGMVECAVDQGDAMAAESAVGAVVRRVATAASVAWLAGG